MTVVVVEPVEGSAKEVVNFSHEVDADVVGKGLLKEEFLCGVRGVVNKVINVDANVEFVRNGV